MKQKKTILLSPEEIEQIWQKAGIENDFIFWACFRNKQITKAFLEEVLQKKITHIRISETQKEIRPAMFAKYVRCDVYVEGDNRVYIIEMQTGHYGELILRARYNHSAADVDQARRGTSYNELGENIIIFVCLDHPFKGSVRKMLTAKSFLIEQPDLLYEDKIRTIYLDASGTEGEVSKPVQNFLDYVRDHNQGLHDPLVKMIDSEVKKVKKAEEYHDMFITEEMEKRANEVRIQQAVAVEKRANEVRLQQAVDAEKRANEARIRQAVNAEKKNGEAKMEQAVKAEREAAEKKRKEAVKAEREAAEKKQKEVVKAEREAAEKKQKEAVKAEREAAEKKQKEAVKAEREAAEKKQKEAVKMAEEETAAKTTASIICSLHKNGMDEENISQVLNMNIQKVNAILKSAG